MPSCMCVCVCVCVYVCVSAKNASSRVAKAFTDVIVNEKPSMQSEQDISVPDHNPNPDPNPNPDHNLNPDPNPKC